MTVEGAGTSTDKTGLVWEAVARSACAEVTEYGCARQRDRAYCKFGIEASELMPCPTQTKSLTHTVCVTQMAAAIPSG